MTQPPRMTLPSIVLGSSDSRALAAFYRRLLGWATVDDVRDYLDPVGNLCCLFLRLILAHRKRH